MATVDEKDSDSTETVDKPQRNRRNSKENTKKGKSRHRSSYPTPGFKGFAFLLCLVALFLGSYLVTQSASLTSFVFLGLTVVGVGVSVYANAVKPLATNVKQRATLAGISAGFGFALMLSALILLLVG